MSTPTTDDALLLAARASPAAWAYLCSRGRFRVPPHIALLDNRLRALANREIMGLVVEMPPRLGKSEEGTASFGAWYAGSRPDHRVMVTSYGADLASTFGRRMRDDLDAFGGPVFGVSVDPASSAANRWDIAEHRGGVVTAGVGGALTGMGADLLIIDDPVKNQDEAQSETYRQRTWNWWTSTARTRLHPGGVVLVIQTRWHEDDLAGRMQRDLPDDWEVLRLPMRAEADDPLGRLEGAPLWPERYDDAACAQIERAVGSYVWNALYQQRPVAAEGNLLRRAWWQTYLEDPHDIAARADEVIQSWDMTFKDTDGSDYVVGQVWARIGVDRFLLHQVRARMDFPTTVKSVLAMSAAWPMARLKLVEDKANGPAVIAELKDRLDGLVPVEPQGGKIARAVAVSPIVESGHVYLPHRAAAPWVDDFYSETAAFPNGAHDDQVDAATQALIRLGVSREPRAAKSVYGGSGHGQERRSDRRRQSRAERYEAGIPDPDDA